MKSIHRRYGDHIKSLRAPCGTRIAEQSPTRVAEVLMPLHTRYCNHIEYARASCGTRIQAPRAVPYKSRGLKFLCRLNTRYSIHVEYAQYKNRQQYNCIIIMYPSTPWYWASGSPSTTTSTYGVGQESWSLAGALPEESENVHNLLLPLRIEEPETMSKRIIEAEKARQMREKEARLKAEEARKEEEARLKAQRVAGESRSC